MPDDVLRLMGSIEKTTLKPAKTDDEGEIKTPERVEIVFHVPMSDLLRTKLGDLSRLMEGSIVIQLAAFQGQLKM